MKADSNQKQSVQEYYGSILQSRDDLQTSACCPIDSLPDNLREVTSLLHNEVIEKSYGCGSPIPQVLNGRTVLDLGCGTGRDCYVLSNLVGEKGKVIGVDMTDEQLDVARKHVGYHMEKFGYSTPNVQFVKGFIENLRESGIEDNSVDVVVSNCVINLSPDKEAVFSEIFRVLKPGGELYFSDVFSDRRIPEELQKDQVLLGECLSGALYFEDFRRMLFRIGCPDYRIVSQGALTIDNPQIKAKLGMVNFVSATVRAFKVASLEDRCEDYGQVAYYKGSIEDCPHKFILDDHHVFHTGAPMLVCGNTAAMLEETRLGEHFRVEGNREVHLGLFDCAPISVTESSVPGSCC